MATSSGYNSNSNRSKGRYRRKSKRGDQVGQTLDFHRGMKQLWFEFRATDSILKILLILNCKLMYEMYLNVVRAILEKDS